jgi:hypothetical protein
LGFARLIPATKVMFQHIKGNLYVLDPGAHCLTPRAAMPFKSRCTAVNSVLKETSAGNTSPDFEFVYELANLPSFRSTKDSVNHKPMPGFGSVRNSCGRAHGRKKCQAQQGSKKRQA